MSIYNSILVKPGEFMVRRGSPIRRVMLNRLVESIGRKLGRIDISYRGIGLKESRIIIYGVSDPDKTAPYVSRIFGVSGVSPSIMINTPTIAKLYEAIKHLMIRFKPRSIALRVKGSMGDIDHRTILHILSSMIYRDFNIAFNLTNPGLEIHVELYDGEAVVYDNTLPGVGGLPYGVEGCLTVLVSGGIDSALAAWKTMKRGVRIIPVYIDYGEYWGVKAHRRFEKMLVKLMEWVPWDSMRVYRLRGYEKLLLETSLPPRLRCLFCKANMYRAAGYVARDEDCRGIATGEAVGQVASQTLINLSTISRLVDIPIYRPIAFMDKLEIVEEARRLGFEELNISVESCRLKPSHPETAASDKDYLLLKKALDETRDESIRIYREFKQVIDLS